MPTPDHRETVGRAEEARCRQSGDGLLAGIDQVGIDLVVIREGADAEQAIFRLENNLDVVGDIVRNQRGGADAKVHIKTVLPLAEERLVSGKSGARRVMHGVRRITKKKK